MSEEQKNEDLDLNVSQNISKALNDAVIKKVNSEEVNLEDHVDLNLNRVEDELQHLINQSKLEHFFNNLAFRQNLDNLKLNLDKTNQNLGTNADFNKKNTDKEYLTELPTEFEDIKNEFIQLKNSGHLDKKEALYAEKMIAMIDKTQKGLSENDFTKNSVMLDQFDNLATSILKDVHNLDENQDLIVNASNLGKSKLEKEIDERELEDEKRAKKLKNKELREKYVNTDIDIDNNKLLKMSQGMLDNYLGMTDSKLDLRLIRQQMKHQNRDQILQSVFLHPAIFGRSDNLVQTLYSQQMDMNKKRYVQMNILQKAFFDARLEFQAVTSHMKKEANQNPVFMPLGVLLTTMDKVAPSRASATYKLNKLSKLLGARYLHNAGMLAGQAAIITQLKKAKIADNLDQKSESISKGVEKTADLSKVLKDSFVNLNQNTLVNIKSIISDAKQGVLSPVVTQSIQNLQKNTQKISNKVGNKLKNALNNTTEGLVKNKVKFTPN